MDWNDDGDSKPCELDDSRPNKGDTVDLYPDVFVGRAPVGSVAGAQSFASKIIAYETAVYDPFFHEAALFMGDILWDYNDDGISDAHLRSEEIWLQVHLARSPVIPADKKRFYDTGTDFDGDAAYDVTANHMADQVDSGYGLIWAASHGNNNILGMETSSSFSSGDALDLVNLDNQGIVYTMACNTNWFDSVVNSQDGYSSSVDPCLSEAFIRNEGGGAVAYMGSSRYGWGYGDVDYPFPYGASMQYAFEFFRMLYYDEDLLEATQSGTDPSLFGKRLGAVFASHKMAKVPDSLSYGAMRWLQFTINLMGDPFMAVMVKLPQDSDLDRDIDGADIAAFIVKTGTIQPDLWEVAQNFGGSFSQ